MSNPVITLNAHSDPLTYSKCELNMPNFKVVLLFRSKKLNSGKLLLKSYLKCVQAQNKSVA